MDSSFWALVALVIFIGIVAYFGVPAMISKSLDDRANKIRTDLDEARKLREEAQTLLAEYQTKRKDAEVEAGEIVAAAKREAEAISTDAHRKTQDYVTRRTALAEQKIAQAESQAVAEVKASAVDVAVEAARDIIASKTAGGNKDMFAQILAEVRSRLN